MPSAVRRSARPARGGGGGCGVVPSSAAKDEIPDDVARNEDRADDGGTNATCPNHRELVERVDPEWEHEESGNQQPYRVALEPQQGRNERHHEAQVDRGQRVPQDWFRAAFDALRLYGRDM